MSEGAGRGGCTGCAGCAGCTGCALGRLVPRGLAVTGCPDEARRLDGCTAAEWADDGRSAADWAMPLGAVGAGAAEGVAWGPSAFDEGSSGGMGDPVGVGRSQRSSGRFSGSRTIEAAEESIWAKAESMAGVVVEWGLSVELLAAGGAGTSTMEFVEEVATGLLEERLFFGMGFDEDVE